MGKKKLKEDIIKGKWFDIHKKVKRKIRAKYDKIRDWKMDPNGYFLILVDKKKRIIDVGFCKLYSICSSVIVLSGISLGSSYCLNLGI